MSTHESDPALEKTVSAEDAGVTPGGAARDGGRLPAGAKLGRYEIVEFIGGGGMGWVYRAKDTELEREVAIKVVQPAVAGPKGRDRLLAEARAMAKLRHRAVVPVHDVGEYAGGVYVAMALVKGGTLHDWMHAEARPWRQVVARFLEAGRGLVAAHAAGIVHRDFKPRNVLVGEGGEVLVADFGIASASVDASDGEGVGGGAREVTSIVGTPAYMAPEQAAGLAVDARADQYSFCVSLWEGLHGQRPQEAETRTQGALLAGASDAPKSRRRVPGWLTDAVARGFASAPEKRWPTLAALLDRLERGMRRRKRVAAVSLAIAAVAVSLMVAAIVSRATTSPMPSCAPPRARIDGAWDNERAERLRVLFVGLDPSRGRTRADRAVGAFDEALRVWGGAYVKACRETKVDRAQSEGMLVKRLDCLDRALVRLASSIQVLETAETAKALESRLRVLDRLPVLENCLDVVQLSGQPGPPSAPAALREYQSLSAELEGLDLERFVGNFVGYRRRAADAVARARRFGHPRLLAHLLDQLASALHNDGDFEEEVRIRKEAIAVGAEAHDDLFVADVWTSLVGAVAESLERPDEAEALLLPAEAAVARAGNLVRFRYDLIENRVMIAKSRGDLPKALELVDEGVRMLERDGARTPGTALANRLFIATGLRAMILRRLGRTRESIDAYLDTIAQVTAEYGPDHAFLQPYLGNLAQAYYNLGDSKAAVAAMQRSSAIAEQNFGPSPRLAEMLWGLGSMLVGDGQFEAALPHLERSIAMGRDVMAPSDVRIADSLATYGIALVGAGRAAAGVAPLKESVAIYRAAPPSVDLGLNEQALANAELAAGQWSEALASYAVAIATLVRVAGPHSVEVAAARLGPVGVWVQQRRWSKVLALTEGVLRDGFEDAANVLDVARFWRSAALVELRRGGSSSLDEAKRLADALRSDPGNDWLVMNPVDAWLAQHAQAPDATSAKPRSVP